MKFLIFIYLFVNDINNDIIIKNRSLNSLDSKNTIKYIIDITFKIILKKYHL